MKIIKKNLIDALLEKELDIIFHCCNCRNDFGKGIAKEIKRRVPSAYEADKFAYEYQYESYKDMLGKYSFGGL